MHPDADDRESETIATSAVAHRNEFRPWSEMNQCRGRVSYQTHNRTMLSAWTFALFAGHQYLEVGSVLCPLCLVLDLNLPGLSGLQLQERLRRTAHAPPVIVITSHRDPAIRALAEETVCRVPGKAVRGNDPACRDRLDRRKSALLLR